MRSPGSGNYPPGQDRIDLGRIFNSPTSRASNPSSSSFLNNHQNSRNNFFNPAPISPGRFYGRNNSESFSNSSSTSSSSLSNTSGGIIGTNLPSRQRSAKRKREENSQENLLGNGQTCSKRSRTDAPFPRKFAKSPPSAAAGFDPNERASRQILPAIPKTPERSPFRTNLVNTPETIQKKLSYYIDKSNKLETQLQNSNVEGKRYKDLYSNLMDGIEQNLSCSICAELFLECSVTRCGHSFCNFCIDKWLKTTKTCPICRTKIRSSVNHVSLNNFLENAISVMPIENQTKRKLLIEDREATKRIEKNSYQNAVLVDWISQSELDSLLDMSVQMDMEPYHPISLDQDIVPLLPVALPQENPIGIVEGNFADFNPDIFADAVRILLGGQNGSVNVEFN